MRDDGAVAKLEAGMDESKDPKHNCKEESNANNAIPNADAIWLPMDASSSVESLGLREGNKFTEKDDDVKPADEEEIAKAADNDGCNNSKNRPSESIITLADLPVQYFFHEFQTYFYLQNYSAQQLTLAHR